MSQGSENSTFKQYFHEWDSFVPSSGSVKSIASDIGKLLSSTNLGPQLRLLKWITWKYSRYSNNHVSKKRKNNQKSIFSRFVNGVEDDAVEWWVIFSFKIVFMYGHLYLLICLVVNFFVYKYGGPWFEPSFRQKTVICFFP